MAVDRVEFYVDGELVGVDYEEPYECYWDASSLPDGSEHEVVAVAYDTANNNASDTVRVRIDNTPPSLLKVSWSPARPGPFQYVVVMAYAEDALSGIDGGLLYYRVNYGEWHAVGMSVRYCGSITKAVLYGVIPGLPRGSVVQFFVAVYDRAGNEARSPVYTYVVGGKGHGGGIPGHSFSGTFATAEGTRPEVVPS